MKYENNIQRLLHPIDKGQPDKDTEEELQHIYISQCDCGDFALGEK